MSYTLILGVALTEARVLELFAGMGLEPPADKPDIHGIIQLLDRAKSTSSQLAHLTLTRDPYIKTKFYLGVSKTFIPSTATLRGLTSTFYDVATELDHVYTDTISTEWREMLQRYGSDGSLETFMVSR